MLGAQKLIRALRIVLGILACLLSLPVLHAGGLMLWYWFQVRSGQVFYIEPEHFNGGYLGEGIKWTAWGGVAFAAAAYAMLRRDARIGWLSTGVVLALTGALAVVVARFPLLPVMQANGKTMGMLFDLNYDALLTWSRANGHCPANATELQAAVAGVDLQSPFLHGGASTSYRLIYVAGSDGPVLNEPPSKEPGVVYWAVSRDLRQGWLTATVLEKPVGGPVVWLKELRAGPMFGLNFTEGKPIVYHVYLTDEHYRPLPQQRAPTTVEPGRPSAR